jgi:hypothetical protein
MNVYEIPERHMMCVHVENFISSISDTLRFMVFFRYRNTLPGDSTRLMTPIVSDTILTVPEGYMTPFP